MIQIYRFIRWPLRYLYEIVLSRYPILLGKRNLQNLRALRDKHIGEEIVLIGGGPSINKLDLSLLANKTTIACNAFHLKMEELDWEPTYYVVEDPLPAKENREEINREISSIKLFPNEFRRFLKRTGDYDVYVNFRRSYGIGKNSVWPRFNEKDNLDFYWGGTVMFFSIQLAVLLGCSKIYLIGVDLNYKIPSGTIKKGTVLTSTQEDPNHFDPRYFGAGKKWHLPETDRMQKAFDKAYEYCSAKGVEIVNIGVDSKLKTIPRESYTKAMQS